MIPRDRGDRTIDGAREVLIDTPAHKAGCASHGVVTWLFINGRSSEGVGLVVVPLYGMYARLKILWMAMSKSLTAVRRTVGMQLPDNQ